MDNLRSVAFLSGVADILEELELIDLKVEDISQLAEFHNLCELALDGCKSIRNLEPLAGLRGLRKLNLRNTGVGDLSALRGLHGL